MIQKTIGHVESKGIQIHVISEILERRSASVLGANDMKNNFVDFKYEYSLTRSPRRSYLVYV